MPQITPQQAIGQTIVRTAIIPAGLRVVTLQENGVRSEQVIPLNGAASDLNTRAINLIEQLKQHSTTPEGLAHSDSSSLLPTGLLTV